MRRNNLMIAVGMTVLGFSASTALAQSDGGSESGLPEQNLSEEAQALLDEPTEAPNESDEAVVSDKVSVSLGDWNVRTTISDELDIAIADIPLTVAIDPDLASSICPVRESDLAQQEIVSAIRTCAAKSVNDDLLEAVTVSFEQPEAQALDLEPVDGGSASEGDVSQSSDPTGTASGSDTPTAPTN